MSTIHHKKSHSDEDEILIEEQGEALQNIFDLRAIDTLDGNEEDEVNLPGSNIVYVGIHEKLSDPSSTSPPTPLPTTPPPLSAFTSLRAYHQSSNSNSGNNGNGAIHHKQSQEKNGVNPEELPEIWKAPPAPVNTESPTPAPTEDVRRVNPAPDSSTATTDMGGKRVCSSVDGSFGTQSSKNNGVVLRYQYELTQDLSDIDWNINSRGERDGSDYLKSDVLPVLEGAISDWLLPELFEECVREDSEGFVIGEGGRRLSDVVGSNSALDEKSGGLRQQRRLSSVIGLDAEPVDFALEQTGELLITVVYFYTRYLLSIMISHSRTSFLLISNLITRMHIQLYPKRPPEIHPMPPHRRSFNSLLPSNLFSHIAPIIYYSNDTQVYPRGYGEGNFKGESSRYIGFDVFGWELQFDSNSPGG